MEILKKILLISICIFILVGCDQTSKKIAKDKLKNKTMQSYLSGNIKFIYAENNAGMLGLGSILSEESRFTIFRIIVPLLLTFLFVSILIRKSASLLEILAFILFLGGGLGNLLDRFINDGKVVDFIVLGFFNYNTGIFNIADVYIMTGIVLLLLSNLFNKNTDKALN